MTRRYAVEPDTEFLRRILDGGGEDLKKCFQCGACSVVCQLSNDRSPFPRKEMIWAQWGLKDRLLADPDVWLCHQCDDCSTSCPRGARPGDVLAAIRQQTVEHYAMPRFLGKWVNQLKYLPLTFLVPAVLLLLALAARGPLEHALGLPAPHGFYAKLFPHWLVIALFSFFTGLAFLAALFGVVRFWLAMKAADESADRETASLGVVRSILRTLGSIFSHEKVAKCTVHASRRLAHVFAFYGFTALGIVTVWAVADLYVNPYILGVESSYPFGLLHPMKIVANFGCGLLILGCIKAIVDRKIGPTESRTNSSFDWIFLWVLLSAAITGLFTEVLRFAVETGEHYAGTGGHTGLEYTAFVVYFVHLVLVFQLLVYLPYSKFAHIVYRTVAMAYAEQSGRNQQTHLGAPDV